MSREIFAYEIPFIDRVTMPRKATWMCDRLGEPCDGSSVRFCTIASGSVQ